MPHKLKPCGTLAAYRRHKLAGEQPCEACLQAQREYYRDWDDRRNRTNHDAGPGRSLAPCGTEGGFRRHRAHGEPVDEPCMRAHRAYQAAWARDRRAQERARRDAFADALAEALMEVETRAA